MSKLRRRGTVEPAPAAQLYGVVLAEHSDIAAVVQRHHPGESRAAQWIPRQREPGGDRIAERRDRIVSTGEHIVAEHDDADR